MNFFKSHIFLLLSGLIQVYSHGNPTPPPTPVPTTSPTVPPPTLPPVSTSRSVDAWAIGNTTAVDSGNAILVSNSISTGPKNASVELFEFDCSTPVLAGDIVSIPSLPSVYDDDNVTFSLFIDESLLDSSGLVVFDDDSTQDAGTILFCTRLITKTGEELGVTQKKTKFAVGFDLSNVQFTIASINLVAETAKDLTFDITFSVSACECDVNFLCTTLTYVQSSTAPVFMVCLTPSTASTQIENMNMDMTGTDGNPYKPVTFGSNAPKGDEITTFDTEPGTNTLRVNTRIVDSLFDGTSFTVDGRVMLGTGNDAMKDPEIEFVGYEIEVSLERAVEAIEEEGCFTHLMKTIRNMF